MNTLLIVAIIIVAFAVLIALSKGKAKNNRYPYQAKKLLLSKAERSFYGVLSQAVGDTGLVFAKVRVADAISPSKGLNRSDWQKAFNAISAKHFDFVICDPADCSIKLAIELDDASHNSAKTQKRDTLLNGACDSAGLRLLRIKAAKSYAIADIKRQIEETDKPQAEASAKSEAAENSEQIGQTSLSPENTLPPHGYPENREPTPNRPQDKPSDLNSPPCPTCAGPMLRRTAKSGNNAGQEFWGCSTFPECRGTAKLIP